VIIKGEWERAYKEEKLTASNTSMCVGLKKRRGRGPVPEPVEGCVEASFFLPFSWFFFWASKRRTKKDKQPAG
jgi:hypothetical protein